MEAFRQGGPGEDLYRYLPGFGGEDGTLHPQNIPHIHLLQEFVLGGEVLLEIELNLAAFVQEMGEGDLPHAP